MKKSEEKNTTKVAKMKTNNKKTTQEKKKATGKTNKTVTKESAAKIKKDTKTMNEKKVEEKKIVKEVELETPKTTSTPKKQIKKSDIGLVIGLLVVIILGCFLMKGETPKQTYELPLTLTGEPGLTQLTYAEYQEKIDNNESFVVIIERATCSHCVNYMPVAESFVEDNNLPMYYVDTDTFSESDWAGFEKSNSFLRKNSNEWGTPTTVVLAGSEAVDFIEGEATADRLLELYDKYFEKSE